MAISILVFELQKLSRFPGYELMNGFLNPGIKEMLKKNKIEIRQFVEIRQKVGNLKIFPASRHTELEFENLFCSIFQFVGRVKYSSLKLPKYQK